MSFLIDAKVFETQVRADMESARLSRAFELYYRVRGCIPIWLRQLLQRNRNKSIDVRPGWFLPDSFMSSLAQELQSRSGEQVIHAWPDNADFGLVLTHDVETIDGFRNIAKVADIEESLGLRSSWSLVPTSYKIDMGLVRDLVDRGFEIAIHGHNHDGKLFLSKAVFEHRATSINKAIGVFAASGFRAPMVHRNLEWLQCLDIDYDASCFDIDPYQAMPGGVGSIWPFIVGKLVELPYTMPQDHTLTVTLNESSGATWRTKLEYLRQRAGMVMMLTHPDYMTTSATIGMYQNFLEYTQNVGGYWHALPRDVASWWRDRDASEIHVDRIVGPAADRGSIRTLRVDGSELSFFSG
ncbi:hypothetical protein ACFL2H_02080 [Planctomycetota bacterium]